MLGITVPTISISVVAHKVGLKFGNSENHQRGTKAFFGVDRSRRQKSLPLRLPCRVWRLPPENSIRDSCYLAVFTRKKGSTPVRLLNFDAGIPLVGTYATDKEAPIEPDTDESSARRSLLEFSKK